MTISAKWSNTTGETKIKYLEDYEFLHNVDKIDFLSDVIIELTAKHDELLTAKYEPSK